MGTGYVRQSAADIVTGQVVEAAPINAEFNQLRDSFHETSGHSHDGTTGEGPLIGLTTSISGVLPVANGGFAGIHKVDAITAPVATNDSTQGYAVGSVWADITNDKVYVCIDSTATAAIWLLVGVSASGWQPLDASLTAYAALVTAADKGLYFTGADTPVTFDLTAAGRALLDDANAAAQLVTLGLTATATELNYTSGVTSAIQTQLNSLSAGKQNWDATLNALAGLTTAADQVIYSTGIDTFAMSSLTTYARTLLDDADAATARTTLGLTIGTNVQAWDAQLDDIAALAVTDGNFIVGNGTNWVAESGGTVRTSLGLGLTDNPQFNSVIAGWVNLGGVLDTTIQRVSAGVASIEGVNIVTVSSTDTLTNKTIDANGTGNSITNLEVADFTAASIVTEAEGLNSSDNDTSVPTTAAVKDYVDTATAGSSTFDMPVGSVMDYAGTTAPSKWLFAYGQAISRTTYADLFTALSTTYGVGDGSTTFNLPDLRGRVTAGKDDMGTVSANRLTNQSGGLDGDTLGANGGAETHTLTVAQMPAHTHTTNLHGGGTDNVTSWGNNSNAGNVPVATTSAGSGNAHNNVQPTFILNKIIYTGVA